MTMAELVAKFDEQYEYPLEKLMEKYLPRGDRLLDWIFAGVFTVERFFVEEDELDEHDGPSKKEMLTAVVEWIVSLFPIPAGIRAFLWPIFKASLPFLIDRIVAFLNKLAGNEEWTAPEERKSFTGLVPSAQWTPDKLGEEWVTKVAEAIGGAPA